MPEIKHTFTSGRMNKDLDERLVPNGEYRDAQNVEVLTSEDSNAGTVQTCLGNSLVSNLTPDDESICVGSIADDKTNNIYYLVAGNPANENISSDIIVEYNSVSNETLPVMVDIYNVQMELIEQHGASWANSTVPIQGDHIYSVVNNSGLRVGMEVNVHFTYSSGSIWQQSIDKPIIVAIEFYPSGSFPNRTMISLSSPIRRSNGTLLSNTEISNYDVYVNFTSPRVLNFHKDRLITGINIIDDMLFWTDNYSEPKKVNITRGKQGSIPAMGICNACNFHQNTQNPYTYDGTLIAGTTHTELVVKEDIFYDSSNNPIDNYIQEKHITVIKKSPLTPPKLEMYDRVNRFDVNGNIQSTTVTDHYHYWGSLDGQTTTVLYPVGTTSIVANNTSNGGTMGYFNGSADFRIDDILLCTNNISADPDTFSGDDVKVRLKVIASDSSASNPILVQSPMAVGGHLEVKILYIDPNLPSTGQDWLIRLENETQSLYELKFPKFAYRYKYEDGEYSAFSPFSEIAFLPQKFEYEPKKGYNLGMVNGLKQLYIKDFIPPDIPLDVVKVDILYKESDSPNIYTIRSFENTDPEWNSKCVACQGGSGYVTTTNSYKGFFEIKDDLIHAVVPSNQLLRPWDNVPRKALAQEITGNRIVYGNYIQNYDLKDFNNDNELKPTFKTTIESDLINEVDFPETSLKSMRTYQVGVIYKDIYGRETPVMTHPSGVVKLDAAKAEFNNKFTVQTSTPPPIWANSFKYFVKEISNEYYNLAMDRWYYAGDENVWLSFPSEDRNKIDEEDTLILKKTNLSNDGVTLTGFVSETPRYKILAIENEAPDFIKTIKTSFGKLDLQTTVTTATPPTSNGINSAVIDSNVFPFKDFDQIWITQRAWESSPFASLQNKDNQSGYLNSDTNRNSSFMIRIVYPGSDADESNVSNWYDITNITFDNTMPNPNSRCIIKIDGIFKDDVLFATSLPTGTSNTTTGIIAGLQLEIGKKTMENKAQFDGRFFVKVEADQSIEKHIMGHATPFSSSSMGLTGGTGTGTDAAIQTWRVTSSKQLFFNAYNVGYNQTNAIGSRYEPSVGTDDGRHIRTQTDWESLIFDQADGTTGCSGASVYATSGGKRYCAKRSRWYIDMEPTGGNYHLNTQGNHPGRGAELGVAAMDISWAGVYSGYITGVTPQDVGHAFPEEQIFINLLETKGRKFRFTNDPDGIVYTITDWSTHDCYTYKLTPGATRAAQNHKKTWRLTLDKPIGEGATTTAAYGTGGLHPWQPTNPYTSRQYNRPNASTNAINGTVTCMVNDNGWSPGTDTPNITGAADEKTSTGIEFVQPYYSNDNEMPVNPAIWETEPKKDVGLDIYYEIGQAYPINMDIITSQLYIQIDAEFNSPTLSTVTNITNECDGTGISIEFTAAASINIVDGDILSFKNPDGSIVTATAIGSTASGKICISSLTHGEKHTLPYYNCYTYGNGVESNRIRDLYNAVIIDKGVKASSTIAETYEEENRKNGLIFSGIYNSKNGVNRLNQFIMAEDITKDLNPSYGSIQKLHTRDDDLVTLCEDKIVKVLANKDALYNADDTKNITATSNVLGNAIPFVGEYGISKNPESFASEAFRAYFTDRERGAVLRLSRDGLTPISDHGMKDWFADNLKEVNRLVGSYDSRKSLYNINLQSHVYETIVNWRSSGGGGGGGSSARRSAPPTAPVGLTTPLGLTGLTGGTGGTGLIGGSTTSTSITSSPIVTIGTTTITKTPKLKDRDLLFDFNIDNRVTSDVIDRDVSNGENTYGRSSDGSSSGSGDSGSDGGEGGDY